jgi:hypothetical protein
MLNKKVYSITLSVYTLLLIVALGLIAITCARKVEDKQNNLSDTCRTVISVDQNVKENIRDQVMTGDTQRLIDGEDKWFNDQLAQCLDNK